MLSLQIFWVSLSFEQTLQSLAFRLFWLFWNPITFLFLLVIFQNPCWFICIKLKNLRVQWFWLFFTFWGLTTKIFFNFIHGVWKFLAKTGNCVFFVWFKSLILGALFDKSYNFFSMLIMGSLIHIQNFRSLSQKLKSQENGQDRVQNISVCKVLKVNFI